MYMDNVRKYKDGQAAVSPARQSLPNPLLVDLLSKERVGVDLPDGVKAMSAANNLSNQPEVYAAGAA